MFHGHCLRPLIVLDPETWAGLSGGLVKRASELDNEIDNETDNRVKAAVRTSCRSHLAAACASMPGFTLGSSMNAVEAAVSVNPAAPPELPMRTRIARTFGFSLKSFRAFTRSSGRPADHRV